MTESPWKSWMSTGVLNKPLHWCIFCNYILYHTISWCYTIDTTQLIESSVLIIRSLYITKSPFFIGFFLITFTLGALKGFWRQHITKILDKQLESKKLKYNELKLKHHQKGIYRKFTLYSLHKSKSMTRKLLHTLFLVLLPCLILIF